MTVVVSLKEVIEGLEMVGDEMHVYLNKTNGEIESATDDLLEIAEEGGEWPETSDLALQYYEKITQIVSTDNWVELPSKYDIFEYRIMEQFCASVEDEAIRNELQWKIHGSGAFRRFHDTIHRHGIIADWYAFRERALRDIAVDWLEEKDIPYTDDYPTNR